MWGCTSGRVYVPWKSISILGMEIYLYTEEEEVSSTSVSELIYDILLFPPPPPPPTHTHTHTFFFFFFFFFFNRICESRLQKHGHERWYFLSIRVHDFVNKSGMCDRVCQRVMCRKPTIFCSLFVNELEWIRMAVSRAPAGGKTEVFTLHKYWYD